MVTKAMLENENAVLRQRLAEVETRMAQAGSDTLYQELYQKGRQVQQLARLYATQSQVNQMIVRVRDCDALYRGLCQVAVEFGQVALAWVGLVDCTSGRVTPVAHAGKHMDYVQALDINVNDPRVGEGPTGFAIRTGRLAVSDDIRTDDSMGEGRDSARQQGLYTSVAIPLRFRDQVIGALNLYATEPGFFRAPEEMRLLKEIGQDVSFALGSLAAEAERRRAEQELAASDKRYRLISENCADVIWLLDMATQRFTYVSPSVMRLRGFMAEQAVEQTLPEMITPESYQRIVEEWPRRLAALANGDESARVATDRIDQFRRDGSIVPTEVVTTLLTNAGGEVVQVVGVSRDVTERRQAEDALRANRMLLQGIVENTPSLIYALDMEGRFILANRRLESALGVTGDRLIGQTRAGLLPPEIAEQHWNNDQRVIQSRQTLVIEEQLQESDGDHTYLTIKFPLLDVDGRVYAVCGNSTDITARKRAEELSLAERDLVRDIGATTSSREAWQLCLGIALRVSHMDGGGIYMFDADRRVLALVYHQGLGDEFIRSVQSYPVESPNAQLLLAGAAVYYSADQVKLQPRPWREGVRSLGIVPIAFQGRIVGALNVASHRWDRIPEFARHALETMAAEIGNRFVLVQAEAARRASEEKYRSLIESMDAMVATLDVDGNISYVNEVAARAVGVSPVEFSGKTMHDVFPEPIATSQLDTIRRVVRQGQGVVSEKESFVWGQARWLRTSIQPTRDAQGRISGVLINATDVTDSKRIQEALQRRVESESLVARISTTLLNQPNESLDAALVDILADLARFTKADRANIWLVSANGMAVINTYEWCDQGIPSNLHRTLTVSPTDDWVKRGLEGGAYTVDDTGTAPALSDGERRYYQSSGIRSLMSMTYIQNRQVVGCLGLDMLRQSHNWDREDTTVLKLATEVIFNKLERRRVDDELHRREYEYRTLAEHSLDPILRLDGRNRIVYANSAALEVARVSLADIRGKTWTDAWIPIEAERMGRIAAGGTQSWEIAVPVPDQAPRHFRMNLIPERNPQNEFQSTLVVAHDITEIMHVQHQLEELNQTLEQRVEERTLQVQDLYDHAPCAYHSLDADGVYVRVNQTELDWLGHTRAEIIGVKKFSDLITDESRQTFVANFDLFKTRGWVKDLFFEMVRKDGTVLPVSLSATALYDAAGQYLMSRTTMVDMTERLEAERNLRVSEAELRASRDELAGANAALARAARLKDEFLANMSHELRTPLTGILGLSEVLAMGVYGSLTEKQSSTLHSIEESGRHLLALINDILDLSKIEAGKLDLEMETCDAGEICQASLRMVRQLAIGKSQQVAVALRPAEIILRADPRRLKQILVNLLSNAVKFTPEGGELGLEVLADSDRGAVQFTVWDKGIGIAQSDIEKLFRPFVQLDSRLSRNYAGTGLGLALVNRLAQMHGGQVRMTSTPGQGSRFTLVLPWLKPALAASAGAEALPSFSAGLTSALIVDDSAVAAAQLEQYLHTLGIQNSAIHPRATGALERVREMRPAVVLLDVLLPDGPGWDVLRQLKTAPDLSSIPVIVVSVVDDRRRALALGATEHLLKPVALSDLQRALAQAGPAVAAPLDQPATVPAPAESRPAILLVENNPVSIQVVTAYLTHRGYEVAVAADGHQALEMIAHRRPRLVFMDVEMPGMDGLKATRLIRAQPDAMLAQTPIVALTALVMPGDRERCLAAGMNDYMSKPVHLPELDRVIRQYLEA